MNDLSLTDPGPGVSENDVKEVQTRLLSKLVAKGYAFKHLREQHRQEVERLVQKNAPGAAKWQFPMQADGLIVENAAGEVVAAVVAELQEIGPEYILRVAYLVVSSESRGSGLGTALLSMLDDIPSARGMRIMQTVGLTSKAAIAPFRRAGFTVEESSSPTMFEPHTSSAGVAIPSSSYQYRIYK